mmetsp:Transcript_74695/g.131923  ORF Transcript_74695/g.131923 Transcript_74695/m.131923 type:complete len:236 (+) Transcript_74695:1536-2243(+)
MPFSHSPTDCYNPRRQRLGRCGIHTWACRRSSCIMPPGRVFLGNAGSSQDKSGSRNSEGFPCRGRCIHVQSRFTPGIHLDSPPTIVVLFVFEGRIVSLGSLGLWGSVLRRTSWGLHSEVGRVPVTDPQRRTRTLGRAGGPLGGPHARPSCPSLRPTGAVGPPAPLGPASPMHALRWAALSPPSPSPLALRVGARPLSHFHFGCSPWDGTRRMARAGAWPLLPRHSRGPKANVLCC